MYTPSGPIASRHAAPTQATLPGTLPVGGRFNDPAWLIHGGWDTLGFLNLKVRESWSGYALECPGPARRSWPCLPKPPRDGSTCPLTPGTIRFYFAPDWSTGGPGGGPGGEARLLEFGAWSAQGQETFCWLGVDGLGSTIRLVVNGASGPVGDLVGADPVDGRGMAPGGPDLVGWRPHRALPGRLGRRRGGWTGPDRPRAACPGRPGFCIGSDGQGTRLAQGQFEEVYTFSRACTAEELAWNWQVQGKLAALGPISEEEDKALLESVAQLKAMPAG